jgi:tRNA/tmRNA/rRNA uracil-C5-methylase (TrmA/RlmC/RlmD family)
VRSAHLASRPLTHGECQSPISRRCILCFAVDLTYENELAIKNNALQEFWKAHFPGNRLDPVVPSPRGRAYRTVTKRRVFASRGTLKLGLIDPSERGPLKPFDVVRCAIEPDEHSRIYGKVQELIGKPYAQQLATQLSYVIIKGNYTEYCLIFSVRKITAAVVSAANTLSKSMTQTFNTITSVFLYEDSSQGRFYMGVRRQQGPHAFKKIFGKRELYQRVAGRSFLLSAFILTSQSISRRGHGNCGRRHSCIGQQRDAL